MKLITADFETFYSKDFSLSKMSTEAYVRSLLFETIGVSVKVDAGETRWYSGPHVRDFLEQFDIPNNALLAHNAAFDGLILSHHYGIQPKMYYDTLSMAKPITGLTAGGSLAKLSTYFGLGEKGTEVLQAIGKRRNNFTPEELAQYGAYCCNDVELTYKLFAKLRPFSTPQEMYIIDMLLRMYTDPVLKLNRVLLKSHLEQVRERKAGFLRKLVDTGVLAAENVVSERMDGVSAEEILHKRLMSNPQLAELLESLGVKPPMKTSPTTGKETYAFSKQDANFKALLEHPDEQVQAIVAARLGVKSTLEETRAESFLAISERGPLPILLNYYGGHTGRASGGDGVNLQNLTRGGKLRESIQAPPGHKLVAVDSSQIEARMTAWLAGELELVDVFARGGDVYSEFASRIFGRPITKADKKERFLGKTCILGLGYGTGWAKLRDTVNISGQGITLEDAEAQRIVKLYRETYAMIPKLWKQAHDALVAVTKGNVGFIGTGISLLFDAEGIHLPNGMIMRYPGLRRVPGERGVDFEYDSRYGPTRIHGPKIVENVVQALARIVVFNQTAKIDQWLRKADARATGGERYKLVLSVHDEAVACVPDSAVEVTINQMVETMSVAPKWATGLPVACESAWGSNYADCK